MTLNRGLLKLVLAGLGALGLSAATAAPLTGTVSSAGVLCLGSTGATPPGTPCTHQDVSTLLYLDFINGGTLTATPGAPANLLFLTATGDLMPLAGQTGSINDFAIPGPADPLASFTGVDPLWTATGTDAATYTYALSALTNVVRVNGHALGVFGTGMLCRNGIDCNAFSFLFTTQDADGAMTTTFSLSQSGATPGQFIAEPGSLALLGLGMLGLAVGVRRRARR
jgi:hypothetical protein